MKTSLPRISALACIALAACVLGSGVLREPPPSQTSAAAEPPIDVPIDHPGPRFRLVGRLGKPIGETVTLQGFVVGGPSKGFEDGPNIIVQRINGEATQRYLRLPIEPYCGDWGAEFNGRAGPPTLEMQATFEFQGFETGGFVGIPGDAYERAGVILQTCSHYFRSSFCVISGSKKEPICYSPADFVDREALLEGTARNRGDRAAIEGSGWEIVLDGPAWAPIEAGKLVHAFGTVRRLADGSFRIESGASSRRGMVKLEDQVDREVSLRGTAWNMNAHPTFNYRGEELSIEFEKNEASDGWPHGEPVSVSGVLERLAQPTKDDYNAVVTYTIKRATWQRTGALLVPEIDMTNPQ